MIVWYLDLQLPMQSVAISIRARCTTLFDIVCQWLATSRRFSPGPPVSSTNKTDRHDITEILLKVALSTIKQTNQITEHKKRLRQTSLEMHYPPCDAQKYGAVKQAYGIPTPLISGCPLHTLCSWNTIYNGNISIWYFSTVSFKITKSHIKFWWHVDLLLRKGNVEIMSFKFKWAAFVLIRDCACAIFTLIN